jgi:hypothetical protein
MIERKDTKRGGERRAAIGRSLGWVVGGLLLTATLRAANPPVVIASPDRKSTISVTNSAILPVVNESFQTAVLRQGGVTCWTYGCIGRGFSVSWTPDSSGFLFGITHLSRSMTLFYVGIEDGLDVMPVSIDLDAIKRTIAAALPKKPGNSAPKSGVNWDSLKWISPTTCRMRFFQRFLGENADSVLEIDVAKAWSPVVRIVSTTPR